MDDSREGRIIFDLFGKERGEKIASTSRTRSGEIDTYIGSFVTGSAPEIRDSKMWQTYGKHMKVERVGCTFAFEEGYLPHLEPVLVDKDISLSKQY